MGGLNERFKDLMDGYATLNGKMEVLEGQYVAASEFERAVKPMAPLLVKSIDMEKVPEIYGLTPDAADLLVALDRKKSEGVAMNQMRLYFTAREVGVISRSGMDDAIRMANLLRQRDVVDHKLVPTELGSEIAATHAALTRENLLGVINDLRKEVGEECERVRGSMSRDGLEQYRQARIILDRAESAVVTNSPLIVERNLGRENSTVADILRTIRSEMAVVGSTVVEPVVAREYSTNYSREPAVMQSISRDRSVGVTR